MSSQLIQPTPTASSGILCSPTQIQLLMYQFLLHAQSNVDSKCMQSLQDLVQFGKDGACQHQLQTCQQEVQNMTSVHFNQLISMYRNMDDIEADHTLEISIYENRIASLSQELQELKRNTQKSCPKEVVAPEESVTEKQVSSAVLCEQATTVEKLNNGLVHATSVRNPSLANNYLACGADPNSALHLAAYNGFSDIVKQLLDRGADVNLQRKNDKWTPLHIAVQQGHLDVVRLLLSKGAETDVRRTDECTPLYQASALGNVEIVQVLLGYSASLELRCENGFTPLHVAAKKNHVKVASVLLGHAADVNGRNSDKDTGLQVAAKFGNLDIVKLMIQHNANIDLPNKDGWTALHNASQNNYLDVAKVILEAGADVNVLGGPYLISPLFLATWKGNEEMVNLLIRHNANVSLPNKLGWTPLHVVCQFINLEIAKYLLDAGADVNIKNPVNGFVPLHVASNNGALDMVQLLVNKGANPRQSTNDNVTPRSVAIITGHQQVAWYLTSLGG